ncbi:MAG: EthD family reductase [Chloroflexota bacterium]|nr:EthD family reductase [Chloroflexota bacterium]
MVKLIVQFYLPGDVDVFEFAYNDFLALVERMPSVRRRQVNSVLGSPVGETRLYRILEVYFDDYAQMEAALRSPAGQEAGGELRRLPGGFEMIFTDVYEEVGGVTPTA